VCRIGKEDQVRPISTIVALKFNSACGESLPPNLARAIVILGEDTRPISVSSLANTMILDTLQ
jgi:hypothetical protein